ncbi:MAG: OFA family MFS transporter [Gudongella sp.]|nr:OFA family MFS transporter [Gudongella sp.]
MERSLDYKRYKILWAATSINFISGLIYMWSVISKSLIEDLGFTSKQASLPYTTFTISFVIAMIIFGKMQDKKGPRLVATIGSILMGSGLILSGLFTQSGILVLTMGIIAGAGVGILTVCTSPPVVKWFPPEKKGMVTGIVVAGAGLSATMYSPLANYLIKNIGVSKTFIYIGIIALIVSFILSQFIKNPNPGEVESGGIKEIKRKSKVSVDCDWKEMLHSTYFYKLWIMLAFSSSAGLMIIGHITNIAKVQANWQGGFKLVIIISIFNTLGRILGGSFSDKIGRLNLMKIIFTMQTINMFAFSYYRDPVSLGFGVGMAGLCYGAAFPVFPSAITDLYGLKNFGINYGLVFSGWGMGGIIGPMIAASIFDVVGNYNASYLVAAGLLVVSIAIAFTFNPAGEKNLRLAKAE